MGKCKVLQLYVPFNMNFTSIVEMFKFNGIKVDDCCDVSKDGKLIGLWIDEKDFDSMFTEFEQHTGKFL